MSQIPSEFFRALAEVVSLPCSAVDEKNRFTWCNQSWEQAFGYSLAELQSMTWLELTANEFIGGAMKSVESAKAGKVEKFSLEKELIHKFGRKVPIKLTVWRFPRNINVPMTLFIVEALTDAVDSAELKEQISTQAKLLELLEQKINVMEERDRDNKSGTNINIGGRDVVGGDRTGAGRDGDTYNAAKNAITIGQAALSIAGIVAIAGLAVWGVYYVVVSTNPENIPAPPNNAIPNISDSTTGE